MINRQTHGRERPSLRWMAVGLLVALAAGLGGWAVAERIAAEPPAAPSLERVLDAGPARLKVSTAWVTARRPPELPGLAGAPAWTPYSGLATTVTVALVPADDAALVPSGLVKAAQGGLPKPERARVVGLEARAYRGVRTGDSVLDVYAIPTTRGVLTLVCAARNGAPEAPTWCLNGLDQITVAGARPLQLDRRHRLPHAGAGGAQSARRVTRGGAQGTAPRQRPGRARAFRAEPLAGLQGRRRRARAARHEDSPPALVDASLRDTGKPTTPPAMPPSARAGGPGRAPRPPAPRTPCSSASTRRS